MKRTCKQCGKEFELSESEIRFYKEKGLALPKRCKSCRDKNKGRDGHAEQKQNPVSTLPGNPDNHNDRGRNNKSYVVVSAVAVLLVLIVFGIKSVLTVPSEGIPASEDIVSPDIQSNQDTPDGVFSETPTETIKASAGKQQTEHKDEEQPKEQPLQQPDAQTQQSPQKETLTEINAVETAATKGAAPETPNIAYHFRKAEYLTEHFQKHGAEFPYATEEEYLLGANNVIQNPNALHKLEAEDGDDVYFVESTGEFVIVSTDGYIRTYFIADLDYYNRQ